MKTTFLSSINTVVITCFYHPSSIILTSFWRHSATKSRIVFTDKITLIFKLLHNKPLIIQTNIFLHWYYVDIANNSKAILLRFQRNYSSVLLPFPCNSITLIPGRNLSLFCVILNSPSAAARSFLATSNLQIPSVRASLSSLTQADHKPTWQWYSVTINLVRLQP